MKSYFDEVVSHLTSEDTNLLGILSETDASANFKAMSAKAVQEKANLTEAKFRKIVTRMTALKFVQISADYKEHALFITPYGHAALSSVLQTMVREVYV